MTPEGKSLLNIFILGFGFMFMFTAFQTCGNVEQTVIKSYNSTEFHGSGYTSMSIIYGVFSASNLIAPSVVAVVGPQLSMFFSGLLYSGYIAMFIHPFTWSFYTASVLVGIGAAVLWTAQGNLLTINSTDSTIGRNSGIFWALLQFSLFFGNLYIYFAWHGKVTITDKDRQTVFISLTVISLVGSFLFFLIQRPEPEVLPAEVPESPVPAENSDSSSVAAAPRGLWSQALEAFKKALQLSVTKEMLLLSISIGYTGLMEEPGMAVQVRESKHPYDNNTTFEDKVHIPGAIYLSVKFDSRCYTEEGCDELQMASSGDFLQDQHNFSGSPQKWTDFEIPGDTLHYRFISGLYLLPVLLAL